MTGYLEQVLHTEELLGEYFVIEGTIVSTRTADLYRALDKSRNAHVSLWVMRRPFQLNSPAVKKFVSHMSAIQQMEPPVSNVLAYGVDASGVAFSVFPNLNGFPISSGNIEPAEAERRLTSAARLVDRLHLNDIVLGDICGSSFWVERTGEIRLIGIMGSFDAEFVGDTVLPPLETMNFLAPEQAAGSQIKPATDVFAMGVLGYLLFTKQYPFRLPEGAARGEVPPIPLYGDVVGVSKFVATPPVWADQVFQKCLNAQMSERYASTGGIVAAINQIRENVFSAEKTPARVHREGKLIKTGGDHLPKVQPGLKKSAEPEAPPPPQKKLLLRASVVIGAVFLLSFLIFRELLGGRRDDEIMDLVTDEAMRDPQLGPIVKELSKGGDEDKKDKYYRDLERSDDPMSHDILIQAARSAPDDKERARAETALLDRARRLGLKRSVEVVRPWLRSVKGDKLPEAYEPILRSLDGTLPLEARNASLRKAYTNNPRVVLRLAAGLSIDTGKFEDYQKVLSQLVGDSTRGEDLSTRAVPSIILFSTELVSAFGDDVIQNKEKIPDADIPWLLNILSLRNDIYVRPIASLAVEKGLLPALKQRYLSMIRDREDLPPDILNTLVKAAAGTLAVGDVSVLGTWWDRQSEDILILMLGDSFPKEVKIEAFDILAAKNFSREPTSTLTKWVRANAWDKRESYVDPIGLLSNLSLFNEDQVMKAIEVFEPNMKDPAILNSLLGSNEPLLVRAVIQRYPQKLGLGKRFALLSHVDKSVRMMALKSLYQMNDVAGLKIILDNYNNERDPEVRKAYVETFEFIRERETKKGM